MRRLLIAVALLVLVGADFHEARAADRIITIGTGAEKGVYYPAGGAICRLVSRGRAQHGIRCFAEATDGSIYNLRALRQGDIDFAIVQSDWQYAAYKGEGVFASDKPFTDLRSVFSLHSEMFTVAVSKDSGIKNFAGLAGKRVNLGDQGSGMRAVMTELMKIKGWTDKSFAMSTSFKPTDAATRLCHGDIDAMVFTAGHPNGLIQDITSNCGAKLIPVEGPEVDALLAKNPYYARTAIPGGMYAGNPQNTSTFGVKATLVTTTKMGDEEVYQVAKAVFDNFDSFKTLHFVFATLDKDRMVSSGLIAPIHPGALKYYREAGLIKEAPAAAQ